MATGETLPAEALLPLKKLLVQLFMVQGHTQITILPKSANQIGVSSMVSPQSGVLALNFVAPPAQIAVDMPRRRSVSKAKIPLRACLKSRQS